MLPGTLAVWLTLASSVVVALITFFGTRFGPLVSRRTEIDKMYMERVKTLEAYVATLLSAADDERREHAAECEALHDQVFRLREQLLTEMGSKRALELAEEQIAVMRREHKLLESGTRIDDNVIGM